MTRFVAISFLCALSAEAANYYVDFSAGSDAAAGTIGAPWKHCPGDANATGTAASTTLNGGDTVIFKGGVSYVGKVQLNRSGTVGSTIVYDGNTAGTFGSGRASMNFTNHPTINIAFQAVAAVSNLAFRGFSLTEIGGYDVLPATNGCTVIETTGKPGVGFEFYSYTCMDLEITDCLFSEIGEWHPVDPFDDSAINGQAISLQNAHRVTISGCDFTKMFNGVAIKTDKTSGIGTSDITITNCNFHNYIVWGVDMAGRATGCTLSNIWIVASDFHDYQEMDLGQWSGCGDRPHTDGIFIRNVYTGQTWAGWNRIEGCRFYNTNAVGGGSACISITEGPSFDIINNLFMNTVHGRTIYLHNGAHVGDAPQTNRVWHNTFWNDHTAINFTRGGFDLGFLSVKGNIFYDTRTGSGSTFVLYSEENYSSMWPDELDYNVYVTFNTTGAIWLAPGLGDGELTFSEMQALGYEANGKTGDPSFVDRSQGVGVNILDNDLSIASGSNARDFVPNLLSWDKYRTARPQGALSDAGFYEFTSGGGGGGGGSVTNNTPRPFQFPRNLRIQGAR